MLYNRLLQKLQAVQNAAARLVVRVPKHCHISPILAELHWLPIKKRIDYKVLLIVFKALHNLAPAYITELLQHKPISSRALRSNDKNLLIVPRSHSARYGDRNFYNVAPVLWNNLPQHMRNCDDLDIFKKQLKTLLFKKSYL